MNPDPGRLSEATLAAVVRQYEAECWRETIGKPCEATDEQKAECLRRALEDAGLSALSAPVGLSHHPWCNYWTKPIGSAGCICEPFASCKSESKAPVGLSEEERALVADIHESAKIGQPFLRLTLEDVAILSGTLRRLSSAPAVAVANDAGYMAVYERERKWMRETVGEQLTNAEFNTIVARLATSDAAACRAGEWLPIESAPKTTRAILIYVTENRCSYAASWSDGEYGEREGWLIFGGDWREHIQRATHWQPLPAAPAHDGGGEGR